MSELSTTATPSDADDDQREQVLRPGAADDEDAGGDRHEHEGGAEVGLQHDEPERDGRDQEHGAEAAAGRARSRNWAITAARPTISASFVSSDGCSWNGPRSNHAWAPLRLEPIDVLTSTSSATHGEVGQRREVADAAVVDGAR